VVANQKTSHHLKPPGAEATVDRVHAWHIPASACLVKQSAPFSIFCSTQDESRFTSGLRSCSGLSLRSEKLDAGPFLEATSKDTGPSHCPLPFYE
jgi:hypothetical protein